MNEQQRMAYEHPMALADGVLPESFIVQRRAGRHGFAVGLSLNK